jgi:predicted esterase
LKQVYAVRSDKKFRLKYILHPAGKNIFFRFIPFYTLILFQLFSISCSKKNTYSPVEPALQSRGQLISSTLLGVYTAQSLQQLVNPESSLIPTNLKIQYDVTAYKIEYCTVDPQGNLVIASGCLSIPSGQKNLPLLSFHHGTETQRSDVASQNPIAEETFESVLTASLGYYSLQPDYLGFGSSTEPHPYLVAGALADEVVDFILACRSYANSRNISLNGQVFLCGYSEGGFVTLAAQKEIEQNYSQEIKITASAPMAGPYDMLLTAQTILKENIYPAPENMAFVFYAYNNIYVWNKLNYIFNSPYAENIPQLFNGSYSTDQIDAALPDSINELLKQTFIDSLLQNEEPTITNAFINNSLINWTPSSPTQFYQGDADEIVPYENSVEAFNYFLSKGCNVKLTTIHGGTHESSGTPSFIDALTWFQSFELTKISSN